MSSAATPGPKHNNPPVIPPTVEELLADLQARYPEVKSDIKEVEDALATYPVEIAEEDQAKGLLDCLGKAAKAKSRFEGYRKTEKKPWDALPKVVQNFFVTATESLEKLDEKYRPRLKAYTDRKEEEARAEAQRNLEAQQAEAEKQRLLAEERAMDALWAEARQELAEHDERKARERAEQAERDRVAAEERMRLAAEEEKRIAAEKRVRETAEKERNTDNLRQIRQMMKAVEKLDAQAAEAEEGEINEDDAKALDAYIRVGGTISTLATPVAASLLLNDEQKAEVEELRSRLDELRKVFNSRLDAKEKRRRAKLAKEEDDRQKAAAAERARLQAEEDKKLAAAKAERAVHEAAAEKAKGEVKSAKQDIRGAISQGDAAYKDQKAATRDADRLDTLADRADNRADRMERKLENSTDADFGRVRGDLGTTGSGSGRWTHQIVDEVPLRASLGELGPYFTEEALSGAVYQWMAAHRSGWDGERQEGLLPGVVFIWDRNLTIRA